MDPFGIYWKLLSQVIPSGWLPLPAPPAAVVGTASSCSLHQAHSVRFDDREMCWDREPGCPWLGTGVPAAAPPSHWGSVLTLLAELDSSSLPADPPPAWLTRTLLLRSSPVGLSYQPAKRRLLTSVSLSSVCRYVRERWHLARTVEYSTFCL